MPNYLGQLDDLFEFLDDALNLGAKVEGYRGILRAVCWIGALVSLGVALFNGVGTLRLLHRGITTAGTISRYVTTVDRENGTTTYIPEFAFRAEDSNLYEVKAGASSNPSELPVGKTVPVLYERGNPSHASLTSVWQMWGMVIFFGAMGAFACGFGYILLRFERWLDRKGLSVVPQNIA